MENYEDIMENFEDHPYLVNRLFIYSEVVARNAIVRYCAQHNLDHPEFFGDSWLQSCPPEAQIVVAEFGKCGDLWNGKSNNFVSQSEIEKWKGFLMISDKNYQEFFSLTQYDREGLFTAFKEERSSDDFWRKLKKNKKNNIDHFANNSHGQRLILLLRLSRRLKWDMEINYMIREYPYDIEDQQDFEESLGKDGFKFNGLPNDYLSLDEIDYECNKLGITWDEYTRFFSLHYGERVLLMESRFIY